MDKQENLKKLNSYLKNEKRPLFKKRISNDLAAIVTRIEKGEYGRGSFTKNIFDIEDKMQEVFSQIEFYTILGRTWEKILKAYKVLSAEEIVDLCPGYSPKIELALYYSKYDRKVTVIDNSSDALSLLSKFMKLFTYEYQLNAVRKDLYANKKQYEIVIGNHIIDDLALNYYAEKVNIPREKIYADEKSLISIWKCILREKDISSEIAEKLVKVFKSIVKKNGILFLSEYKSYIEKMLDMDEAYEFNKSLFKEVSERLVINGFLSLPIPTNTFDVHSHFNADEFIALKRIV